MNAFKIENVRIETITDFDMVKFDVVTESGRVELAEHVNYDADGDFKSVERTDSNIKCNMEDELCSVFDLSEKPSFMPALDFVPFDEIIDEVENVLAEEFKHYAILVGAENMKPADRVVGFLLKKAAEAFAASKNEEIAAQYDSVEEWKNDGNSLEWVVFSAADAADSYPELLEAL